MPKKIGVLVLGAAVACGIAEGFFRWFSPQQLIVMRRDIWMPHPVFGWSLRPNIDARINSGERTVRIVTDGEARRTLPPDRPRVNAGSGRKPMLIVGDSFVEAIQVPYETGLSHLVGVETSHPVKTRATGGWDPNHYLAAVRWELASVEYRGIVVVLYIGNDIVRRQVVRPRSSKVIRLRRPRSLRWKEWVDALVYPTSQFFETRSHLFVAVKNRTRPLRMIAGLSGEYYVPPSMRKDFADAPAWNETAALLTEIDGAADAAGVPCLFVVMPSHFQIGERRKMVRYTGFSEDRLDFEQPSRKLSTIFNRHGLDALDLLPVFEIASAQNPIPTLYGAVDPHLSPAGHRVAAKAIADALTLQFGGLSGVPDGPSKVGGRAVTRSSDPAGGLI